MKIQILIIMILLVFVSRASSRDLETTWETVFGTRIEKLENGEIENSVVFLMRSGFFGSETVPDFKDRFSALLRLHPDCAQIDVARSEEMDQPATYVWLISNGVNLNIEMVRKGWFAADTQAPNPLWRSLIPEQNEEEFLREVRKAEKEARDHGLGIWHESQTTKG